MPNPANYSSEDEWMSDCVPMRIDEGDDQDEAVAACLNMWRNRDVKASGDIRTAPVMTSLDSVVRKSALRRNMEMAKVDLATVGEQRAYSVLQIKAVDSEQRMIEGIATTPSTDRIGDIVEPMGAQFKLPLPLLWQHRHDEPVGTVEFAETKASGIKFRAQLAKIDEPGLLKDMLDRAWQSIKAGLVRGVSIGFKAREWSFIEGTDGIRFKVWDWLELSLVTIPANVEANITTIKSFDAQAQAALGQDGRSISSKHPGVTGSRNLKPVRLTTMKTFAEQITALEAKRAANEARMAEIMQRATDEGRSTDEAEQEEFDTLEGDIKTIDGDLKRYRVLDANVKTKAKPVDGSSPEKGADSRDPSRNPAGYVRVSAPQVDKGIRFARLAKCIGMAKGNLGDAQRIAESRYGQHDQGVVNVLKVAVAAGTTDSGSWTGALVGDETNVFADFVEYLRPMTILGKFGANGVPPLKRAPFRVPLVSQTGGGAGYWVGEGAAKGLTSFNFERTTLEPLKVANIAVVTEEVLRDSSPSAEAIIRDSLAAALRERLDTDFISPTKTASAGVSPASVTNGVSLIASSGTDADAVRRDVKRVVATFVAANNPPNSGVWVMSSQTALSLSLMYSALSTPEFGTITMNGGTLFGMPVITSEYIVPAGSPNSWNVYLVNASDIYLGDDGGISVDMSREASLQMDTAPSMASAAGSPLAATAAQVVSLWQTNSVGFRAERTINWAKRRSSAVAGLSGVAWS